MKISFDTDCIGNFFKTKVGKITLGVSGLIVLLGMILGIFLYFFKNNDIEVIESLSLNPKIVSELTEEEFDKFFTVGQKYYPDGMQACIFHAYHTAKINFFSTDMMVKVFTMPGIPIEDSEVYFTNTREEFMMMFGSGIRCRKNEIMTSIGFTSHSFKYVGKTEEDVKDYIHSFYVDLFGNK